jgi:hypothetical protein
MFTPIEWKQLNHLGVIPKEKESIDSFSLRAKDALKNASYQTHHTLDFFPFGLKIEYCRKHLWPWEAACVFTHNENAVIYLQPQFQILDRFFTHHKQDIIEHECIHLLRKGFVGNRFEELLACHLSPKRVYRLLGGFIRTPIDSWVFITLSCSTIFCSLIDLYSIQLLGLTSALFSYFSIRSIKDYYLLKRVKNKLCQVFGDNGKHVLFRLTEREICLFSSLSVDEIKNVFLDSKANLRIYQILMNYSFTS